VAASRPPTLTSLEWGRGYKWGIERNGLEEYIERCYAATAASLGDPPPSPELSTTA
jgi:hypothetical protein